MDNNWKQDPRLKQMSKEKLDYLTDMAEHIKTLRKDQLLPAFASMQMEATKKGMSFNNDETELILSILSADMTPAEKNRLNSIRALAKKMAARDS